MILPKAEAGIIALYALALSLAFLLAGFKLKGYLEKRKIRRFLIYFALVVFILALGFQIMKQAEHFRRPTEDWRNISYLVLNPLLELGSILESRLPAVLRSIPAAVSQAEQWVPAHRTALTWGGGAAGLLLLLLLIFLRAKDWKSPFALIFLLASLGLGTIAIVYSQIDNFPVAVRFGAWGLGCLIIYSLLERFQPDVAKAEKTKFSILLLLLIVIAALCLRTYQLSMIAARFDNWEGIYGLQTIKILSGQHPTYLWGNTAWRGLGHTGNFSALYLYLLSFFFRVFGPNIVALKLLPAVCGAITVYLSYLFFKLIFKNNPCALIAAALLAFSPLQINFSRSANMVSISSMTGMLILYLLFYAIKNRHFLSYFCLGIVFSFMGYFYEPIAIFFPLACLLVVVYAVSQKGFLRRHWFGIILAVLAIFLVIELLHLPVWGRMFPKLLISEAVWHRTQSHHFTSQPDYRRAIPLILENFHKLFLSFIRDGSFDYNFWPGGNLYFNPLLTVFLFWGIIYSLMNFDQAGFRIVLLLTLVFLPPNVLSRPPVITRRLLFMFPLLYFFAALPLYRLWEEISKLFGAVGKWLATGLLIIIIGIIGSYNSSIYFHCGKPAGRWETERFFDEYVKKHIGDYYLYILPLKANSKTTIDFLLWEEVKTGKTADYYRYLNNLDRLEIDKLPENKPIAIISVPQHAKRPDLERLKTRIGRGGRIEEYRDKFGQLDAVALLIGSPPEE